MPEETELAETEMKRDARLLAELIYDIYQEKKSKESLPETD
ncbi:MAG: hypothetical protein JWP06_647 [Candidatus Saccharibacteria bacterium]|nr:hypothetical protein [Candidatus Saccharibacteria bacterium]